MTANLGFTILRQGEDDHARDLLEIGAREARPRVADRPAGRRAAASRELRSSRRGGRSERRRRRGVRDRRRAAPHRDERERRVRLPRGRRRDDAPAVRRLREHGVAVGAHTATATARGSGGASSTSRLRVDRSGDGRADARAAGARARRLREAARRALSPGERGRGVRRRDRRRRSAPAAPRALLAFPGSRAATRCADAGLVAVAEGFADRAYDADGQLVPRGEPGALLDAEAAGAAGGRAGGRRRVDLRARRLAGCGGARAPRRRRRCAMPVSS